MSDYTYIRVRIDGYYNINNINHTNGGSNPVPLYVEIKDEPTLPNSFKITSFESNCIITFDPALTGAQETTLTNIVTNHKIDN